LRVRFLRAACPACWLLDVSRLIASRMVFRAQGESPAPRSWKRRATCSRRVVRRVCSELIMWYRKLTILDFETPFGRNRFGGRRNRAGTGQEPRRNRFGRAGTAWQEPSGRAGTVWPRGRNRSAARQEPFGRWAVPAAGAGQEPHGRTTPIQNLKTLAFAAISIFWHAFCSAEKRLTTRSRTCRGRAQETSSDHRTRKIAPLLCGRFLTLSLT
jgi:hypothetical protein